jgi:hypothetical protein
LSNLFNQGFPKVGCYISDEDIPITPPLSPTPFGDEDVVAKKPNEIRIGPITRARAKLLEQQVNSLLIKPDLLFNENFILPKSMQLCMIGFVDNTSIARGGDESQQEEQDLVIKCAGEEREAGARRSPERQVYIGKSVMAH